MALKNTNPTSTKAWKKLEEHYSQTKDLHLKTLFNQNKNRQKDFTLNFNDFELDFSKNRITKETVQLLTDLANEVDLQDAIQKYFDGEKINETENRAVLHTALRASSKKPILVDGVNIKPEIESALLKMKTFCETVISGKWKGYTNKSI